MVENKGKDGNGDFYVYRLGNDDSQAGCNRENSIWHLQDSLEVAGRFPNKFNE